MRKRRSRIFTIIFIISLGLNIGLLIHINITEEQPKVEGTYVNSSDEDVAYLILSPDNVYYKCRKYESPEQLNFDIDKNGIINVEDGNKLIWAQDKVFHINGSDIDVYLKQCDESLL